MRFLLCGTLAVCLPLLAVALDLLQWTDSASSVFRGFILAMPFAVLATAHLVVIGAAAAGAVAFMLWLRKVFGLDGLVAREPDAYARSKHLCCLVAVINYLNSYSMCKCRPSADRLASSAYCAHLASDTALRALTTTRLRKRLL